MLDLLEFIAGIGEAILSPFLNAKTDERTSKVLLLTVILVALAGCAIAYYAYANT